MHIYCMHVSVNVCVCVCTFRHTYQLSGSHLVENLLSILAVMAALHDGQ